MESVTGFAYLTPLEVRQRTGMNVVFSDGSQLTINDDDNVQGYDPGTGRSVDAGGCGWTLYDAAANKVGEAHDGLLAYDNNQPYANFVFEVSGRLKIQQDGATVVENGYHKLKFIGLKESSL